MRSPIVILGGMGPQASLRLHELLLRESRQYHSGDGEQYPHIVHFSLPVTDFLSDESQRAETVQILDRLSPLITSLQPARILLACNTAHLLRGEVALLQSPAFSSMLSLVSDHVACKGYQRVGILASPTTLRLGLYHTLLKKHGIECLSPAPAKQRRLESVIRKIIAGRSGPCEKAALWQVADSLRQQGVEAILLGCTELPLADDDTSSYTLPVIDCLKIYAAVTMHDYYMYNGGQDE